MSCRRLKDEKTYGYHTMKEILKVAPSVVCVTTTIELDGPLYIPPLRAITSEVNGTIFCCEEDKSSGLYHSFILTSADVLRPHRFQGGRYGSPCSMMCRHVHGKDLIREVDVQIPSNKAFYKGEVVAFDDHYNIAVVLIKSDVKLPTATLMCIDDRFYVGVPDSSTTPLDHKPCYSKMLPGDKVFVIGRQFKSNDLNVGYGEYSADYLGAYLGLQNLFRISCKTITNGGPVIDSVGNVIGIAFGCYLATACLPINIFLKWWKDFRTYKDVCRPCLGIIVADLFVADIQILAPSVHFLGIPYGVIVEEVRSGSPAHVAGIQSKDVIFHCDRRPVRSFLEFFELIWDKKGEVLEVMGIRDGHVCTWIVKIDIVKPEFQLCKVSSGQSLCMGELDTELLQDIVKYGNCY